MCPIKTKTPPQGENFSCHSTVKWLFFFKKNEIPTFLGGWGFNGKKEKLNDDEQWATQENVGLGKIIQTLNSWYLCSEMGWELEASPRTGKSSLAGVHVGLVRKTGHVGLFWVSGSQGGLLTVRRSWRSQFRIIRGESLPFYLVDEHISGKWKRLEREQVTAGSTFFGDLQKKGRSSTCVRTKAKIGHWRVILEWTQPEASGFNSEGSDPGIKLVRSFSLWLQTTPDPWADLTHIFLRPSPSFFA